MKIELKKITVRELYADYADHKENGVKGYGGKLDIRPPYQRNFIYDDDKRNKVIDTVRKGYPLNVMYWVRNPDPCAREDESRTKYEVLDGQQRTLSICTYVKGEFSVNDDKGFPMYFHSLPTDKKKQILDYPLTVYVCDGDESEKLDWFRTINIAGVKLSAQELRNAAYTGPWLADAKPRFSKIGCPAYLLGSGYIVAAKKVSRQEYLETAIEWISDGNIELYMAEHRHDSDAGELWVYFEAVIAWVERIFPTYRHEMHLVPWGPLYNTYNRDSLNPVPLEAKVKMLMADDEVTRKSGIYTYVLAENKEHSIKNEKHLSLRAFDDNIKREAYENQEGKCAKSACQKASRIEDMEADHITPWSLGGKTTAANCQMLCKDCNRAKAGI